MDRVWKPRTRPETRSDCSRSGRGDRVVVRRRGVSGLARPVGGGTTRLPYGIGLGVGMVALIVACGIAALFPEPGVRLAVVAGATAVCAAVLGDARAAFAVGGVGYLLFDGFLVNRYGELGWQGPTSMRQIAVFAAAAAAGLGLHAIRSLRTATARTPEPEVFASNPAETEKTKESHGA